MKILTKKRIAFRVNNEGPEFVSKGGGEIEDAPEWIKKDPMFGWASTDGDLVELVAPTDVKAPEPEPEPEPESEPEEDEELDEEEDEEPEKQEPAPKKKPAAKKAAAKK